jgi:hypothetical protein
MKTTGLSDVLSTAPQGHEQRELNHVIITKYFNLHTIIKGNANQTVTHNDTDILIVS